MPSTSPDVGTHYSALVEQLREMQPAQVVLEYGHFYVDPRSKEQTELLSAEQLTGLKLGQALTQALIEEGYPVHTMLFVDDLHGLENDDPDLAAAKRDRALQQIHEAGWTADTTVFEADLTYAAAYLLGLLTMNGVVTPGSRTLPQHWGGAPLITKFEDGSTQPSCALIDATFYLKKMGYEERRCAVTILHEKYKPQQEHVKDILKAFGATQLPIFILFYNDEGEIVNLDSWQTQLGQGNA